MNLYASAGSRVGWTQHVSPRCPGCIPPTQAALCSPSLCERPLLRAQPLPASASTRRSKSRVRVRAEAAGAVQQTRPPTSRSIVIRAGGQEIKLETGEIGRQANAALIATVGETVIYTTVCHATTPAGDGSFVPFTVNYQERFSAAGRTSTGFIKRDSRPREEDVLTSRLVDRPLRPLIQDGWSCETQVLQWLMSYDGVHQPEPLAITAAGTAMLLSGVPFHKAVAGVRVGLLPEVGLVVNPTGEQMTASQLDLVMAGTKDAVLMIEGFCDFLTEEQMLQALALGHTAIMDTCVAIEQWAQEVGRTKVTVQDQATRQALVAAVRHMVGDQLVSMFREVTGKEERGQQSSALNKYVEEVLLGLNQQLDPLQLRALYPDLPVTLTSSQVNQAFKKVSSEVMRNRILREGVRPDGRSLTEVRPIFSRADLLPRTHGSCLFTRGETQAVCVTTLGTAAAAQRTESIRDEEQQQLERFYLQYFFPPSSVGETGRTGPPGRRELGHGELAERALLPVVPPPEEFPYTIRVESTITESNGSSSMASVCGGCLSMMDAGVPVSRPIAGVAMGLVLGQEGEYQVLTDILGIEDALGDMDFKVAGDEDSITAFQMDIKVEGITLEIMRYALERAKVARKHILKEMTQCFPPPKMMLSKYAPKMLIIQVDPQKVGMIIGSGGRTIKAITQASGVDSINLDDSGRVEIASPSEAAASQALEMIQLLAEDPKYGTIMRQKKVVSLTHFGCFVELCPGKQGMVHVSELDTKPIMDVNAVVKVGDLVDVMVLEVTPDGKLRLSRKAVLQKDMGLDPAQVPLQDSAMSRIRVRSPSRDLEDGSPRGGRGRGRGRGRYDREGSMGSSFSESDSSM